MKCKVYHMFRHKIYHLQVVNISYLGWVTLSEKKKNEIRRTQWIWNRFGSWIGLVTIMKRIFFFPVPIIYLFFLWLCDSTRAMASSFLRFLDHTRRRTTVGRTSLSEWSAGRKNLYLTTHNRQTSMPRWDSNPRSQQASGRRPTP